MMNSQIIMALALTSIATAWLLAWRAGHRTRAVQNIFAALCVQALAALLLSFSTGSILLSLGLAAIILGAVAWMIRSGSQASAIRISKEIDPC
jgi:hypothetical protein